MGNINAIFARNVRRERRKKNMSVIDLAKKAKVSRDTIRRIEKDIPDNSVRMAIAERIADALRVPLGVTIVTGKL